MDDSSISDDDDCENVNKNQDKNHHRDKRKRMDELIEFMNKTPSPENNKMAKNAVANAFCPECPSQFTLARYTINQIEIIKWLVKRWYLKMTKPIRCRQDSRGTIP